MIDIACVQQMESTARDCIRYHLSASEHPKGRYLTVVRIPEGTQHIILTAGYLLLPASGGVSFTSNAAQPFAASVTCHGPAAGITGPTSPVMMSVGASATTRNPSEKGDHEQRWVACVLTASCDTTTLEHNSNRRRVCGDIDHNHSGMRAARSQRGVTPRPVAGRQPERSPRLTRGQRRR